VITSDDTATDIMIAKVGGVQKVNAFLKEQGFKTLHLNMTTNDYFRRPYELIDPKYKTMSASDVFDLQDNRTILTDPRQIALQKQLAQETIDHHISEQMLKREPVEDSWLGVVSPAEIGRMLEGIERGTIASKQACDEMKKALRSQQAGTRKMPHFLSVPIAHKTGETRGVTNDVGMIYAHSGTIIVSFFTNGYTGLASEADDRLGHVARLIVEYFDGTN
jgi:beta-lactamase class A